jgi:ribosomal-protein-alanine N-acetyltransferase
MATFFTTRKEDTIMSNASNIYDGVIWRRGKKVILRPYLESDLPDLQRWINDPQNTQFLNVTWPMHEAGQKKWLDRGTASSPDHIRVAICTHDGTLIGNIGMDIDLRMQSAKTGSMIGKEPFRSQGYGTDAKMLMLDYAFNWRGLRKVTSPIIAFNGRSRRYAEKCGYRHMATIEQEYYRNGVWHDEVLYVVFREEWLQLWREYTKDWAPEWQP